MRLFQIEINQIPAGCCAGWARDRLMPSEDDVLVTDGEPKVLSAGIPSKLEDVEATIAQLRKAMKSNPLP